MKLLDQCIDRPVDGDTERLARLSHAFHVTREHHEPLAEILDFGKLMTGKVTPHTTATEALLEWTPVVYLAVGYAYAPSPYAGNVVFAYDPLRLPRGTTLTPFDTGAI